jgi:hypothetical protein
MARSVAELLATLRKTYTHVYDRAAKAAAVRAAL